MRLRAIILNCPTRCYPEIMFLTFNFNGEFIYEWITIEARRAGIQYDNFNFLYIKILNISSPKVYLYGKSLIIEYPFSIDDMRTFYQISDYNTKINAYIELYKSALNIANSYYDVQLPKLIEIFETFKKNGFKNEFVKMKKRIREFGIYIDVVCKYDAFSYKLFLDVYDLKRTNLITHGLFYEVLPNPFMIAYFCPYKLVVDGNKLYTLRSTPKDTRDFEFDLEKLAKGEFNYKELVKVKSDSDKIAEIKSWLKE